MAIKNSTLSRPLPGAGKSEAYQQLQLKESTQKIEDIFADAAGYVSGSESDLVSFLESVSSQKTTYVSFTELDPVSEDEVELMIDLMNDIIKLESEE